MNSRWSVILTYAGDVCFSSGLLGPDGTSRYLGKWCKRGENKTSNTTGSVSNGSLIAVGSDGRGGRVKVLRSPIHSLVCFYNFISVYHHINFVTLHQLSYAIFSLHMVLISHPSQWEIPSKSCIFQFHNYGNKN